MRPVTVWFNKSFSSTFNAIESLREGCARHGGSFRILCSHTQTDWPAAGLADTFEVEPKGLDEPSYVDWCLDLARRYEVDLFWPGKNARVLAGARERFRSGGTRLLVAGAPETLGLLEDKGAFFRALGPDEVPLPDWEIVNDRAGFDAAYDRLRQRYPLVCFKPAVSVFGLGFRIVVEGGGALWRLFHGDVLRIGLDDARRLFDRQARFRDLMVMQYLPGPERSIDCLALDGTLVRCVVRRKPTGGEGGQVLEDNPRVVDLAGRLTRRLQLTGLINIQFRDAEDVPFLLEVNPRMSGGLHCACLSGLAFPYWAVRLALGSARPEEVPVPRTGLRVGQVTRAVLL